LQTLFVREHNYQVDQMHKEHPHWSGDKLYEKAKAITTAEMVNITYNEFLPHLLGKDAIEPTTAMIPPVDARSPKSLRVLPIALVTPSSPTKSVQQQFRCFTRSRRWLNRSLKLRRLSRLRVQMVYFDICQETLANPLDTHLVDGLRTCLVRSCRGIDWRLSISSAAMILVGYLNQTREALGT